MKPQRGRQMRLDPDPAAWSEAVRFRITRLNKWNDGD